MDLYMIYNCSISWLRKQMANSYYNFILKMYKIYVYDQNGYYMHLKYADVCICQQVIIIYWTCYNN